MREETMAVVASAFSVFLVSFVIAQKAGQKQTGISKTSATRKPVAAESRDSQVKPPARIAPFINKGRNAGVVLSISRKKDALAPDRNHFQPRPTTQI